MVNSSEGTFESCSELPVQTFLTVPLSERNRPSIISQALSDVPSDIIIRSRIKYGNPWSACKGLLMEYSKSTSIHGIRYIFEVHRPIYEKIYWIVLLIIAVCSAVFISWESFVKWKESPVILGFDETLVPVHKIPFPTITICPEIKIEMQDFNFSEISTKMSEEFLQYGEFRNHMNLSEDEISQFSSILHICQSDVMESFAKYIPTSIKPDVAKTLVDLSISKNKTAIICRWGGRYYFCYDLVTYVATDEGICLQFNGLRNEDIYRDTRYMSYSDNEYADFNKYLDNDKFSPLNNITGYWSLDEGFVNQGHNSYPQRTVFASARNSLFVVLQGFEHNLEYDCRSYKQGYRVFLNSPESVPLTTGNYILVPHGKEVLVSILPHYVISSKSLREYSPKKRQCYFNDERYLHFFRSYSQNNCQIECLANYTINKCGCVKFWMPKPLDVSVCQLSDLECFKEAENELNQLIQSQTMEHIINPRKEIICDCLPACTSLKYDFEISTAHYDLSKTLQAFREQHEHSDFLSSRLSIYFKERQFTAIKRTVHFSLTTLIANCGGIFGLFMGISSLSVIELVYFFSVRLVANLQRRRMSKKLLQKDSN